MATTVKKLCVVVAFAISLLLSTAGTAAAQEEAGQDDSGVNVACVASDIGTIGGGLAAVIPGGQTIAPLLAAASGVGQAMGGGDCKLGDGVMSVAGAAKDAVKDKVYDSTLGAFIESMLVANGQVLKTIFSWWIAVPSMDMEGLGALDGASPEQLIDLANQAGQAYSDATGEENPAAALPSLAEESGEDVPKVGNGGDLSGLGNPVAEENSSLLQTVNDYTGSLQVWLLMLGILLGLVRIAWAHQQAQGQESMAMFKGIVRAVLIAVGFSVFVTLGTRFTDALSVWWMNEMVQPDQLSQFTERIVMLSATPIAGALTFLVALLGLLAALVQVVVIIIRNALLVLVVAVMPLAASASLTRAGNSSVEKMMGWTIALLLFKPMAALVYSVALMMVGSGEGAWDTITGMALLAMAVMTLPALLSMVAPATQAVGGGASGLGVAAGAAGAVATGAAALATGGMAAGALGGGAAGSVGSLSKSASMTGGMAGGSSPSGAGSAGLGGGLPGGGGGTGGSGGGLPGGGGGSLDDSGGGGVGTLIGTGGDTPDLASSPADSGTGHGIGAPTPVAASGAGQTASGSGGGGFSGYSGSGGTSYSAASGAGQSPASGGGGVAGESFASGGSTGVGGPTGGDSAGIISPSHSGGSYGVGGVSGATGAGAAPASPVSQGGSGNGAAPRGGAPVPPRPGGTSGASHSSRIIQQAATGAQRGIQTANNHVEKNSGGGEYPKPSGGKKQ
ncbi:MAG: hypothetical protein Q4F64_04360 [Corynebacterium casei]|nr:hypothetical protein [Corynebacterium casei]